MSVTLTQVLSRIGDENILLQFLDQSLIGFKETKHDLEVKFATAKTNKPLVNNEKMGIVIWVDKEKYHKAIADIASDQNDVKPDIPIEPKL